MVISYKNLKNVIKTSKSIHNTFLKKSLIVNKINCQTVVKIYKMMFIQR